MTATQAQLSRVGSDWTRIAGEAVTVEQINSTIYGFCSELGALRLGNRMSAGRVEFSKNLGTWFYAMDLMQAAA